jgi:hypothetical protein
MTDQQQPTNDQASTGSLFGQSKEMLVKWLREEVDDCLPARVISYNDATNRAVIRPIVQLGLTDGSKLSRAQIANIPVYRFGGGGFFMRFPIKAGDLGWLKANDRDISLTMQAGGGEDWPNTKRLHSFSDAVFYPDTFKQWVIAAANADSAVWQSMDGGVCIALSATGVTISVGGVSWAMTAAGINMITPPGGLKHNGKNVGDTHLHAGPATAPLGPVSNTGTPV